jgi:hypothetical protein
MELTKHEKQLKRKESRQRCIDRFEKEKVQSKKEIVTSIHIITLITLVDKMIFVVNTLFDGIEKDFSKFD